MEHLHPGSPPFPPGRLAGKKHARSLRRGNIGLMQSRPNSPPQKWAILRGATEAGSMDALRRHKPRIDGFLNSSLDLLPTARETPRRQFCFDPLVKSISLFHCAVRAIHDIARRPEHDAQTRPSKTVWRKR